MARNIENKFDGKFARFFCYINDIEYDTCCTNYDASNHTQPIIVTWTKGKITENHKMDLIEALDYLSPEIIPNNSDSGNMSEYSKSLYDL
ncbi:MAG: hypothetical protein PHQ66_03870 [Candidatus Nanoarchaeia archaeon]|nr:hypothetical protein [Candidatus Nanoarchaeia archaeon]MDD5358179.1 hypothetical protein [Candidatus Nanoarchaeia archaeon]MDD5589445.1 hypothetical protein [Candidatus Nanoarchaeia archaeon]